MIKNRISGKIISVFFGQVINRNDCKKHTFLFLFMILTCHSYIHSQTKYLIKDKDGFDFILNVAVDGNTINGFTREKALLDYTSKFQFQLIKAASSLKHPEIIRFNAILTNDKFEGTYDYLFSSYKVIGNIERDSISYSLFKENGELYNTYKGETIIDYSKKDYGQIAEDIIKITEENIFDPQIIQSKKWKEVRTKMLSTASTASDDLEFQTGFFALVRNIGFSHYYIFKNITSLSKTSQKPSLEEINSNTVILKIGSFLEKVENIKPLLDTIQQKAYSNLIIDLRDNTGGNFKPASLIANFLTDKEFISGFFPNKNWYQEYDRLPDKQDIEKFCIIDGDSTNINSKYGFYISSKRNKNSFKGNVYFLVNKKTGSTAEALVIGAKEYNLGKIIGENTAGALLSAGRFKIDDDIMLLVPVNDFISYNGYRVDQKGIEPDIKLKKGKDLKLQLIEIVR
jgi:hypothetical protein